MHFQSKLPHLPHCGAPPCVRERSKYPPLLFVLSHIIGCRPCRCLSLGCQTSCHVFPQLCSSKKEATEQPRSRTCNQCNCDIIRRKMAQPSSIFSHMPKAIKFLSIIFFFFFFFWKKETSIKFTKLFALKKLFPIQSFQQRATHKYSIISFFI